MRGTISRWTVTFALSVATACGGGDGDDAGVDEDAGRLDAGPLDAGRVDAGRFDAGPADTGVDGPDAGVDAGPGGDGGGDAAAPDGGLDAGEPDAGDDPDGDGVPTARELACGTDPDDGGDAPSPTELRGDGTNGDPFRICLPEHLGLFAAEPSVLGAHARLGDDLDMTGVAPPEPLGAVDAPYTGTFDGAGHTIANLTVGASDAPSAGLFAYVGSGGVIRDLELVGAVSYGGSPLVDRNAGLLSGLRVDATVELDHHGGLVANRNVGSGVVEECSSRGSISAMRSHIGGLVGQNDGVIRRSSSEASVSGQNRSGGLVGSGTGTIRESFATGAVNGAGLWIGGLIGSARDGAVIEDAFALGSVDAAGGAAGGLVGNAEGTAAVARVYAANAVTATTTDGAILGEDSSGGSATVGVCYFDTSRTATDPVSGCTALSGPESAMQASYVGFDFTTPIWRMDATVRDTPVLHWE